MPPPALSAFGFTGLFLNDSLDLHCQICKHQPDVAIEQLICANPNWDMSVKCTLDFKCLVWKKCEKKYFYAIHMLK